MGLVQSREEDLDHAIDAETSKEGLSLLLRRRAGLREAAGDLDGAMDDLLAAYRAEPKSECVQLAHQLHQRHPASFAGGCPVQKTMTGAEATPQAQPAKRLCETQELEAPAGPTQAQEPAEPLREKEELMAPAGPIQVQESQPAAAGEAEAPWERGWQGPAAFKPPDPAAEPEHGGTPEPANELRNFTIGQLNACDGGADQLKQGTRRRARPIYIALRGQVYDASAARDLYGPGMRYHMLAGHDASRFLARGGLAGPGHPDLSDLDDLSLEGLDHRGLMTLSGWENTFRSRGYPEVGRVVALPAPAGAAGLPAVVSRESLRRFDGRQPAPDGYARAPIYLGVRDVVFDVSFGGAHFYSDGGPYECLAGRDASRVLAKMSMAVEDVEGVLDYGRLSERERRNLDDWEDKLRNKKGYPVVARLELT